MNFLNKALVQNLRELADMLDWQFNKLEGQLQVTLPKQINEDCLESEHNWGEYFCRRCGRSITTSGSGFDPSVFRGDISHWGQYWHNVAQELSSTLQKIADTSESFRPMALKAIEESHLLSQTTELERYKQALTRANGFLIMNNLKPIKLEYSSGKEEE